MVKIEMPSDPYTKGHDGDKYCGCNKCQVRRMNESYPHGGWGWCSVCQTQRTKDTHIRCKPDPLVACEICRQEYDARVGGAYTSDSGVLDISVRYSLCPACTRHIAQGIQAEFQASVEVKPSFLHDLKKVHWYTLFIGLGIGARIPGFVIWWFGS